MKLKEISAIISAQIKNYEEGINFAEEGRVISVGDGICLIYGLDNAVQGELLKFPKSNIFGFVLNLEEDAVGCVLLSTDGKIEEGDSVKRTNKVVQTPVGDCMLGRVLNGIGEPIDGKALSGVEKYDPIEKIAPGVMTRQSVNQPLETGILAIDAMVPIGKGQRELIIGDRQTGKTSIAIDTIINQKEKDVYCVYVAIGQKNSTVSSIVEKLREHNALDYTTIISSSASEAAPLQYLSAYTGITIAEHWMNKGKDVLIIYDDLSKHASAYRTMSLLLRRPPGREAYPGDVFYLHSRLLERSARLNKEYGGGSITALPIIETQASDISSYIPTNVISITDGQIFLVEDLFNAGQRPAIDSGLSVSRVGSVAQTKPVKQASSSLKLELAQYAELQAFSQFGSDLDSETARTLEHGKKALEMLKQKQYQPLDNLIQALLLYVIKTRLIEWIPVEKIADFKEKFIYHFNNDKYSTKKILRTDGQFTPENEPIIRNKIRKFIYGYIQDIQNYKAPADIKTLLKEEMPPKSDSKTEHKSESKSESKLEAKTEIKVEESSSDLKSEAPVSSTKEEHKNGSHANKHDAKEISDSKNKPVKKNNKSSLREKISQKVASAKKEVKAKVIAKQTNKKATKKGK